MPKSTVELLNQFIQLEGQIRESKSLSEFGFEVCNTSKQIIDYHQAIFWHINVHGKIIINAISGVATLNFEAPYIKWLQRMLSSLVKAHNPEVSVLNSKNIAEDLIEGRNKWWPEQILCCPLIDKVDNTYIGGIIFTRKEAWSEHELAIVKKMSDVYQHALASIFYHQTRKKFWRNIKKSKILLIGAIVVVGILLFPIRQSVLAPAEIISRDPIVVASPLDGVIQKIYVDPNDEVKKGQLLFTLDPTDFENRYQLAQDMLQIAEEKYRKAAQHGFDSADSKWQLSILKTEVDKAKLALDYHREMLNRVTVEADMSGVAIFASKNDLLGQPVTIGERIMLLSNPQDKELEIFLPVKDAIGVSPGNKVRLFLNTDPLHPLNAKVRYASYSAEPNPDGTLTYRLKASFPQIVAPRIGYQGTAKVYGNYVTVFYFLFWRPISVIRRTFGL